MHEFTTTRATSLALSTLLLGAAAIAALSMAVTQSDTVVTSERGPVLVVPLSPPPAPPQPALVRTPVRESSGLPIETPFLSTTVSDLDASIPLDLAASAAGPVTITAPTWLRRPRDLARYYPARALARGVEGRAVLECLVDTSGALDCRVISETPPGWGFGEAARRISRDYRMQPATRDGVAVEGRYILAAPFEID